MDRNYGYGGNDGQPRRLSSIFGRGSESVKNEPSPNYGFGGSSYGASGSYICNNPKTYEDVKCLIDHLKMHEQVIVNFSNLDQGIVYRILDFMSGAVYALNGSMRQIQANIFIFAPEGVSISQPPTNVFR